MRWLNVMRADVPPTMGRHEYTCTLQDAKMQAPDMLVPYRDSFTSSQPGVLHQSKRVRSVQTIWLLLLSVHQLVWMGSLDLLEHSTSLFLKTCLSQSTQNPWACPHCVPQHMMPPVLSHCHPFLSCCTGLSSGPADCVHPLSLVLLLHCTNS